MSNSSVCAAATSVRKRSRPARRETGGTAASSRYSWAVRRRLAPFVVSLAASVQVAAASAQPSILTPEAQLPQVRTLKTLPVEQGGRYRALVRVAVDGAVCVLLSDSHGVAVRRCQTVHGEATLMAGLYRADADDRLSVVLQAPPDTTVEKVAAWRVKPPVPA